MEIIITIIAVLVLVVLGVLVWLATAILTDRKESAQRAANITLLAAQLESLKASQDKTTESLTKSLQMSQQSLNQSLSSSQKVLGQLNSQVGELFGSNKELLKIGTDVKRLQEILSSPKLRGNMGEWSLENILSNILPAESFETQHTMKDGKIVDALINLTDYSVPVDAKFPLPSFEAMTAADSDDDKAKLRKQFQNDCIKHIDKIAASYIRPAEGTLDFALMYVPAENIYYETVIKYDSDIRNILTYALEKKVIPVSPNLLYAYLMTVVMGLHGLKIEKQAAEIRQNLKKLNSSFAGFTGSWDILGKHLRNANSQYEEGNNKLGRFGMELTHIQAETPDNDPKAG